MRSMLVDVDKCNYISYYVLNFICIINDKEEILLYIN